MRKKIAVLLLTAVLFSLSQKTHSKTPYPIITVPKGEKTIRLDHTYPEEIKIVFQEKKMWHIIKIEETSVAKTISGKILSDFSIRSRIVFKDSFTLTKEQDISIVTTHDVDPWFLLLIGFLTACVVGLIKYLGKTKLADLITKRVFIWTAVITTLCILGTITFSIYILSLHIAFYVSFVLGSGYVIYWLLHFILKATGILKEKKEEKALRDISSEEGFAVHDIMSDRNSNRNRIISQTSSELKKFNHET